MKVEDILSSFDWGEGSHPLIGSARVIACQYFSMRLYCALSKAKAKDAVRGHCFHQDMIQASIRLLSQPPHTRGSRWV
ncbi:hypothetical protein [Rhizobium hidalgonense]|uniref:hypothetical protein n=1 Tax=Rhizobium hidalgonense TaxID=1538159 RepID=UPI0013FD79E2|nr:hypothetical protein [Rhizobium hidalgonense]